MSAYSDSIAAYHSGKMASSASSAYSTPSVSTAKTPRPSTSSAWSSKSSKSVRAWARRLVSDVGNPPTYRYDQMMAEKQGSASPSSTVRFSYHTNAIGGPHWTNSQQPRI